MSQLFKSKLRKTQCLKYLSLKAPSLCSCENENKDNQRLGRLISADNTKVHTK